jgi:ATP/maltotriose-dependent transcriptional regulator MalT
MLEEASEAAEQYGRHASLAGDDRLAARGASAFATVALHGPVPVREVIVKCDELLANVSADRTSQSVILLVLGVLHAMDGAFDRARELCQRARSTLRELGLSVTSQSTSIEASRVEMLAGDPAAAERLLRADFEALAAMGEKYFRSTIAGRLSHVLLAQGRLDDAQEFASTAEALASIDDVEARVLFQSAQARLLVRKGRTAEGMALAQETVDRARATGDIDLLAESHLQLGEVLEVAGYQESAEPPRREALRLFELKGNEAAARKLRGVPAEVQVV